MGRPSTLESKRRELLPVVAAAFADLGYRRLTSAELAARCGVGENILYRIWPDKQAMFLAALDWIYLDSERTWKRLLEESRGEESAFLRLLAYEAVHQGEHRLYRIVFAGLSETDDRRIAQALRDLYGRFQAFVRSRIAEHRGERNEGASLDLDAAAWAIVGLGTVANIGRELGLIGAERRRALIDEAGRLLAEGRVPQPEKRRRKPGPRKR
jgi:AcrR family transcriptional regulator